MNTLLSVLWDADVLKCKLVEQFKREVNRGERVLAKQYNEAANDTVDLIHKLIEMYKSQL